MNLVENRGRAQLLFVLGFLLFAVLLLTQLGAQAKYSSSGKLFAQPAFWPALSIIGMVLFASAAIAVALVTRRGGRTLATFLSPFSQGIAATFRAVEYCLWFMAYVYAVPYLGYLLATLVCITLLCLRAGFRSKKTIGIGVIVGVAIVFFFKTLLGVKIPGGALYELLPDGLRNFMIVNF